MKKSFIKLLKHVSIKDLAVAGGKAVKLGAMIQTGMPVPPGFVVMTNALNDNQNNYVSKITLPNIYQAFEELKSDRVAVRSSGISEDSETVSWAGQLNSYLNIDKNHLADAILNCSESIHSQRATAYAKHHKIPVLKLKTAVVIQKMVNSEISGVMFTINPVTNYTNELIIEASYGLGELLMQGEITPDNYMLFKNTLKLKSATIGSQKAMLTFSNGIQRYAAIQRKLQNRNILNPIQIKKLAEIGVSIEKYFQYPQDIEFAFENNNIYIIQSRNITTVIS